MRIMSHFIIKFIMTFFIGLEVKNKINFDKQYIIVANHNSHLDTTAIMSLFSSQEIKKLNIVAAEDYFFSNKFFSWISNTFLGLIPIKRKSVNKNIFEKIYKTLDSGNSILIFPEGSRGKNGSLGELKKGIISISKNYAHIPILPIKLSKTEIVLPKGRFIPIPFIIKIEIKEPFFYEADELLLKNIKKSLG